MNLPASFLRSILVLFAAFCWVGPVAAQYRSPEQQQAAADDSRYEELLAATEKIRGEANPIGDSSAAAQSKLLVAYVRSQYGNDSLLYLKELEAYARDLGGSTESRLIYPEIIALSQARYGKDSYEYGLVHLGYARSLAMTGYRAEAAAARLIGFEAQLSDVLNCGRVTTTMILGCTQNEPIFASDIAATAAALQRAGRGAEVPALLDRVSSALEEKWVGCNGPDWRFDCDDVPEYREAIEGAAADYYASFGPEERVLPIRRRILAAQVARFEPCLREDGGYCTNFRMRSAWRDLDEALAKQELGAERLNALETMLRLTMVESGWTKFGGETGGEPAREEAQEIEAVNEGLTLYSELALQTGASDRARIFLTERGVAAALDRVDDEASLEARLVELEKDRDKLDRNSGDYLASLATTLDLTSEHFGDGSDKQFDAFRDYFWALKRQDQAEKAREIMARSLAIQRRVHGDDNFRTFSLAAEIVESLEQAEQSEAAVALLSDIMDSEANRKGALFSNPVAYKRDTGFSFGDKYDQFGALNTKLSELLLEKGDTGASSVNPARLAVAASRAYRDSLGFDQIGQAAYEKAIKGESFLGSLVTPTRKYVLLADTLWEAGDHGDAAAAEAYAALQDAMTSSVTMAVGRVAAEKLVEQAGLGALLAQRAEATEQAAMLSDYDAQARANDRQAEIDVALRAAAPAYFNLIRPTALSLAETRAMLGEGEAILLLYPGPRGTHAIAVTPDSIAWHRSDWNSQEIDVAVKQLRRDLDPAGSRVPQPWSYFYDRATAFELFQQLIAPLIGALDGTEEVYIAPAGSLARIPASVLVTTAPQGYNDDLQALRDTDWLIDRFALVQLPSIQSLRFLRTRSKASIDKRDPLAAFGDPVLSGVAETRGGLNGGSFATGANALRGSLADVSAIRELARLPGTATELNAIAKSLQAPSGSVMLGNRATETRIKKANLSNTRIIAFATHGLLAGEVDGLSEPGLVFTPPTNATAADDGLLTASEISQLDLDADWVLLSACNTAAGESGGAEGLTGLAKSFFYAGARSLLASHWPVRDDLAAILSSKTVALEISVSSLSRAQALRQTMIAVRNDPDDDTTAHPSSWAPFMLVGDGR